MMQELNHYGQAKARQERRVTYFCRLCREYDIVNRKSHLRHRHNASHDTVNKRSISDIINVIFVETVNDTEY